MKYVLLIGLIFLIILFPASSNVELIGGSSTGGGSSSSDAYLEKFPSNQSMEIYWYNNTLYIRGIVT